MTQPNTETPQTDRVFILQDKQYSYLFYWNANPNSSHKLIKVNRLHGYVVEITPYNHESELRAAYIKMKEGGMKRV